MSTLITVVRLQNEADAIRLGELMFEEYCNPLIDTGWSLYDSNTLHPESDERAYGCDDGQIVQLNDLGSTNAEVLALASDRLTWEEAYELGWFNPIIE